MHKILVLAVLTVSFAIEPIWWETWRDAEANAQAVRTSLCKPVQSCTGMSASTTRRVQTNKRRPDDGERLMGKTPESEWN